MRLDRYLKGVLSLFADGMRLCKTLIKKPHYLLALAGIAVGVFYLCGVPPQKLPQWWKETFVPAVSVRVDEFAFRTKKAASGVVANLTGTERQKETAPAAPERQTAVKWGRKPAAEKPETPPEPAFAVAETGSGNKDEKAERQGFMPENNKFKQRERTHPVTARLAERPRPVVAQREREDEPETPAASAIMKRADESETPAAPVVMPPTYAENRAEMLDKMLDGVIRETAQQQRRAEANAPKVVRLEGTAEVAGGDALKIAGRLIRLKGMRLRSGRSAEAYRILSRRANNVYVRCRILEGEDKGDCFIGNENLSRYMIDMQVAD